jgi:hypothetical protein
MAAETGHLMCTARGNPAGRWPPTRLRVLLRDELGIGPSAATKELHVAILGW